MIYGNIDATSWSVREIPPAGYSNAMNIARRDKRRTNSDRRDEKREGKERRNGCETSGRERGDAGAEWRGGARVKDTRKGFLVVYSVCKMSSQYAPRPFFAKGEEKKKGCVSLRADYSMYREPRASQPFLPDNSVSKSSRRWEVMIWKRNV